MIDGLIGGRLHGAPAERIGQNGKPFVTAKVRANGGDGESVVVNVIAFAGEVCGALLALDDGDSIALTGSLTPKAWIDKHDEARPALDMIAHGVMSAYHAGRKRQAVNPERPQDAGVIDDF